MTEAATRKCPDLTVHENGHNVRTARGEVGSGRRLVKEDLFKIPDELTNLRGWSMTILGWENNEPPHVTVKAPRGQFKYRWNLRDECLMDKKPDQRHFPEEMKTLLKARRAGLGQRWNDMYKKANNPVDSEDADE